MQTILIVDDEPAFLEILRMILHRSGYNLLTASDGAQALELIQAHNPDLALIDDMLPGISGGEVCQAVKNDAALCHIPVILYSAGPRVRDHNFIAKIRADAALYKPFRPDEVLRLVRSFLVTPV